MQDLKNVFLNKECVVLSCGPSLNLYTEQEIRSLCLNRTVIAIKLAYFTVPDLVDIHLFNCCNLPPPDNHGKFYSYRERRTPPIVIASSNYPRHFRLGKTQHIDYFLRVESSDGLTKSDCLALSRDYDNWTLDKRLSRRVGPGIMLETLWAIIEHIGVSQIYTLGIDLKKEGSKYPHAWSDEQKLHIPGTIIPWDAQVNINASESLYHWFQSRKINWSILGNSALWEGIPRVNLIDGVLQSN